MKIEEARKLINSSLCHEQMREKKKKEKKNERTLYAMKTKRIESAAKLCSIAMFWVCFHNFLWFYCIVSHRSAVTKNRSQSMKHQRHLFLHVLTRDNSFSHTWRTARAHNHHNCMKIWKSSKCCFSIDTKFIIVLCVCVCCFCCFSNGAKKSLSYE